MPHHQPGSWKPMRRIQQQSCWFMLIVISVCTALQRAQRVLKDRVSRHNDAALHMSPIANI